MDTTHKQSLIAQIEGNAKIDYRDVEKIVKILNTKSETFAKGVMKAGKSRFFYSAQLEDVIAKIKSSMSANEKKQEQRMANKIARMGGESSSLFEATYTRGGHKYVNGVRLY